MVRAGTLQADLARRDFTINAMALDLVSGELIDLHHGQKDLESGQLRLLHGTSVQDDPTRVIRAARYAARLGFQLAEESREQIRSTVAQWPWAWSQGDAALSAPPASQPDCGWSWSDCSSGNHGLRRWTCWSSGRPCRSWMCSFNRIRGARSGCAGPDALDSL
ncbi:MAG: hypothetical protein CM15mP116_00310 [Synechococcus sp.]|nr:MAG: hypothetical protein CM15mP116_00310 [Synechococcus sp.]